MSREFERPGLPALSISLVEPKAPGRTVFDLVRLPRLGTVLLATLANRLGGVDAAVHIESIAPLDLEEIAKADVVGVSTTTSTAPRAYAICDEVRRLNPRAIIVLGGVHVTFQTEEALPHCDHVFIGEADETFPAFIKGLLEGSPRPPQVIGSRLRSDFSEPLAPSPVGCIDFLPDLTLIKGWQRMRIAPVVTSRSCPFSCTFCSVIEMFGQRMRYAGIDSVRANLLQLHELGFRRVFFFDDNFAVDVRRTEHLLAMIRDLPFKLRWSAQVRANTFAQHPGLAKNMASAGCRIVYVGIESAEPRSLLAFRKKAQLPEMAKGLRNLRRAGIMVHGMFVAGSSCDDAASIRLSLRFAKKQKLSTVQFMVLTPLPGTQDADRLARSGRVFDDDWSHYDAHHTVHHPEGMSARLLEEATLQAMRRFYSARRIVLPLLDVFHPRRAFASVYLRAFGWRYIRLAIHELRPYTRALPAQVQPL
ncbi:MAG TPA: radical SAM protein [Fimbriimonadaceae bacterium]|nr:radical SAM protein [Fimbriimonadaceae bacterium]